MKSLKYYLMALAGIAMLNACSDDDPVPGNPTMDFQAEPSSALFGDSLPFTIKASDADVPLSTLKARLYFSDEMVSETIIRTKVNGQDYTGKIYVPYLANIPNGTATLTFILQNINFTITEKSYDVALSRPDFPYLTLISGDQEYRMEKVAANQYSVTGEFAQKVKGYIKAPKVGANGNEINFGWSNGAITQGTSSEITFSNLSAGEYSISFNTLTYAAAPFVKLLLNGSEMEMVDDDHYSIDLNLKQGDNITADIPNFDQYWIDPDFFEKNEDGSLKFLPIDGTYRVIANLALNYLEVLKMNGTSTATLNDDGTGALWIIGDGIGKPSVATNAVGWTTEKGLCMSQIEAKKYQVTVVAGEQIKSDDINFKFFHQQGWGGEYKNDALSTTSDLVFIGDGTNGRDAGNLGLVEGKSLENGVAYRFTVDVTAGVSSAVLTVEKVER